MSRCAARRRRGIALMAFIAVGLGACVPQDRQPAPAMPRTTRVPGSGPESTAERTAPVTASTPGPTASEAAEPQPPTRTHRTLLQPPLPCDFEPPVTPRNTVSYEGWTLHWTRELHRRDTEVPDGWIGDFAYATSPDGTCRRMIFRSHGGQDVASTEDPGHPAQQHEGYRLLSVVGPYVGTVVDQWWTGGAHGGTIFGLRTYDMRTGRQVTLEEVFGREAVEQAIHAPPPMPLVIDGQPVGSPAEVLEGNVSRDPDWGHCGPTPTTLPSSGFATSGYADGRATLHVWSHDDELGCLDVPLKLDLSIRVPDALQPAFEAAVRAGQLPVDDIERYNPCGRHVRCAHAPGTQPGPPSGRRWKYPVP